MSTTHTELEQLGPFQLKDLLEEMGLNVFTSVLAIKFSQAVYQVLTKGRHSLVAQATTYRGLRETPIAEINAWRAAGVASPKISAGRVPGSCG